MFSFENFFHYLFTLPEMVIVAAIVGILIGVGSTSLYLSSRFRRILQAGGRPLPRYLSVSFLVGSLFVGGGFLLFFAVLGGYVSFKGTLPESLAWLFIAMCAVFSFAIIIPVLFVMGIGRRSIESAKKREV